MSDRQPGKILGSVFIVLITALKSCDGFVTGDACVPQTTAALSDYDRVDIPGWVYS